MRRNRKKGVFFTIASLFFALLLITLSSIFIQYKLTDQMSVVRARVISLEVFMQSLEEDLERAAFISGYRGLISLNNYITSKGDYLDNAVEEFEQIIINGTVKNGTETEALMINQTLLDWSNKMASIGNEMGINTEITFISASVSQSDPWNIKITSSFNITIWDNGNTATLKNTLTTSSLLSIERFEDPAYRIETSAQISRKITKSNTTTWDKTAVKEHLESNTYIAFNQSPSYLMRLEGDFGASEYGIETFVDKNEFETFTIPIYNRTNVDYLYWSATSTNNTFIDGITNAGHLYFKLDSDHISFFNVSGDTY